MHAVEQLGVDQAIPSRILDLMKVEGLTRHNVASHLQVGIGRLKFTLVMFPDIAANLFHGKPFPNHSIFLNLS